MTPAPTTDDVGTAIRDALELLVGLELASADDDAEPVELDHIDDSDLSNLRLVIGGAVFVIRVIRGG